MNKKLNILISFFDFLFVQKSNSKDTIVQTSSKIMRSVLHEIQICHIIPLWLKVIVPGKQEGLFASRLYLKLASFHCALYLALYLTLLFVPCSGLFPLWSQVVQRSWRQTNFMLGQHFFGLRWICCKILSLSNFYALLKPKKKLWL